MAKTLADYLNVDSNGKPLKQNRTFYLDDILEVDPRRICPICKGKNCIHQVKAHDPDGTGYECSNCGSNYMLMKLKRKDDY